MRPRIHERLQQGAKKQQSYTNTNEVLYLYHMPLTIYKASAGSGKTFRLTYEYLELLFRDPVRYRHILAVTFTNKAAREMKSRILLRLYRLSVLKEDETSDDLEQLTKAIGVGRRRIIDQAGDLLVRMLNDYSRFSVGTIDRFFQQVIRAFTREIGLQSGFNLELDTDRVLGESVDRMFTDLSEDEQLRNWFILMAEYRIRNDKSWNFRSDMESLGRNLFREKFQALTAESEWVSREGLKTFMDQLDHIREEAASKMRDEARRAVDRVRENGYELTCFQQRSRSLAVTLDKIASGEKEELTDAQKKGRDDISKWLSGKESDPGKESLVTGFLMPALAKVYEYSVVITSVDSVRPHLYALGILNDLGERIREVTSEKNLFMLSDASRFLRGLIGDNPTPFVYEKIGHVYDHIMLDEFQDTSWFQWENFRPLLEHTMAGGHDNLLVGDVKQSIYRWRNSDWKILAEKAATAFPGQHVEVETLRQNWRSFENIVRFNNALFDTVPGIVRELAAAEIANSRVDREFRVHWMNLLEKAYGDTRQEVAQPFRESGGYIRTEILEEEGSDFKELALNRLPGWIDTILAAGYRPGDIAILVRKNQEGARVASTLMEHQVPFVSNDSLFLYKNVAVKFLVSVLRWLNQPDDALNNLHVKYFHNLVTAGETGDSLHGILEPGTPVNRFISTEKTALYRRLPLFELVEQLIDDFGLDQRPSDLPYLQAMQDMILDMQRRDSLSLHQFLVYWDEHGHKKAIQVSEGQDAIRIMTLHKAKGLEFKAVIVPFCDWDLGPSGGNDDMIWVDTTGTPFHAIPILPVRIGRKLNDTFFAAEFMEELMMTFMDNLNLLYVAMTRAEEVLITGIPGPPKKNPTKAGHLVVAFLESGPADHQPELQKTEENGYEVYSLGTLPEKQEEEVPVDPSWQLDDYPVVIRNDRLRLHLKSDVYFLENEDEHPSRLDYGTMMHEIFSRIETEEDVPKVLASMKREGLLREEDRLRLQDLVTRKLETAGAQRWFSGEGVVINERDIFMAGGEAYRPDRVVCFPGKTVVIDYKFGERKQKSHRDQVMHYMKLLEEMNYPSLEGYVWYMSLDELEKVG